jgi:hypothetical protein
MHISGQTQDTSNYIQLAWHMIAVFDEDTFAAAERHADGFRHFDDFAQKQSILLVRPGNEDGLSAPISFDLLKHGGLPLARKEDMGVT